MKNYSQKSPRVRKEEKYLNPAMANLKLQSSRSTHHENKQVKVELALLYKGTLKY